VSSRSQTGSRLTHNMCLLASIFRVISRQSADKWMYRRQTDTDTQQCVICSSASPSHRLDYLCSLHDDAHVSFQINMKMFTVFTWCKTVRWYFDHLQNEIFVAQVLRNNTTLKITIDLGDDFNFCRLPFTFRNHHEHLSVTTEFRKSIATKRLQ